MLKTKRFSLVDVEVVRLARNVKRRIVMSVFMLVRVELAGLLYFLRSAVSTREHLSILYVKTSDSKTQVEPLNLQ